MNRRKAKPQKITSRATKFARITRIDMHGAVDALIALLDDKPIGKRPARENPALDNALTTVMYMRMRHAADALMVWHTSDLFLTAKGLPRPLTLNGDRSLHALARMVAKNSQAAIEVRDDLVTLALVENTEVGYLPSKRSAILGKSNPLSLAYASISISRLIQTMIHNFSGQKPRRFERQVAEAEIRASELPAFLRFADEQGQYLIDAIDDWLLPRKAAATTEDPSVSVGLSTFAWVVDTRRPRLKKRRAAQRTQAPK